MAGPSGRIVFLDTETTGLDADKHQVWEIGYLVLEPGKGLQPVQTSTVRHSVYGADSVALEIGRHTERCKDCYADSLGFETRLIEMLTGATLCAANPAFDAGFLKMRWGNAPWHYRMLDIETYAMAALGEALPVGLYGIVERLKEEYGAPIAANPDHTAGADAQSVAEAYMALRSIYSRIKGR